MGQPNNLNGIIKKILSVCDEACGINVIQALIIVKENLKDDQRSLRSSKAIFDQGGSNDAEQRLVASKFSCILFRSIHCFFLIIVAVISNLLTELV